MGRFVWSGIESITGGVLAVELSLGIGIRVQYGVAASDIQYLKSDRRTLSGEHHLDALVIDQ